MHQDLTQDDPMTDFERRDTEIGSVAKPVFVSGRGPGVIIMPEMPGISPHLVRFARWVRDAGFTVFLPSLFGRPGAVPELDMGRRVYRELCVSKEFRALGGGGKTSPVAQWLIGLAERIHGTCGGPGVGAVGMCFTGNFALTLMLSPSLLAPVMCQPSLPLDNPAGIEASSEDLLKIRARLERQDLTVEAYRFEGDPFCRAERFAAYEQALGPRFCGRVLPREAADTQHAPPFFAAHVPDPHSVVTVHLIDREGEPTIAARDEIIGFLKRRLAPSV